MKTITFLILVLTTAFVYSQASSTPGIVGQSVVSENVNGNIEFKIVTAPQIYNSAYVSKQPGTPPQTDQVNSSSIRWKFTDPIAVASRNMESGNGLYSAVGYWLNSQRISLYTNANSTPLWEFPTGAAFNNWVAISDTGGIIAASSLSDIYMFNRSSSTPF